MASGNLITTLNCTLADERANSYIDGADLNTYWGDHWDTVTAALIAALSPTAAVTLLMRACRSIETLHFTEPVDPLADYHLVYDSRQQQMRSVKTNYGRPQKWNYYQHLQFPRTLDCYQDGTLFVPPEVCLAQAEQAAYELSFDPSILQTSLQGVTHDSVNVSGIAISQRISPKGSMVSPIALNMLKPYLINQISRLQRA
jgi:hypothetical protein